jgi:large subunit ribosomal protein L4e
MVKANYFSLNGNFERQIEMPDQFSEDIRVDLIKRAVLAIRANKKQPYGVNERAGKRYAVAISKKRRDYKGSYGKGISSVAKKTMSRSGGNFFWVGAFAANTVGGRKAYPPVSARVWKQKINNKERRIAIRSALAASVNEILVKRRGHRFSKLPSVLPWDLEKINKTKDFVKVLEKIGLSEELERTSNLKVRAGVGKTRGRKYKGKKGPLVVVSDKCSLIKAALNVRGLDIVTVDKLNAELLAPGCHAGRLTLYTDKAIERLKKENLFFERKK